MRGKVAKQARGAGFHGADHDESRIWHLGFRELEGYNRDKAEYIVPQCGREIMELPVWSGIRPQTLATVGETESYLVPSRRRGRNLARPLYFAPRTKAITPIRQLVHENRLVADTLSYV